MWRLTGLSVRHPWATLALVLALSTGAAALASRTEVETGVGTTLGADHPAVRELDRFLSRFGGGYPIVVAWECRVPALCESVFSPASLEMARAVSRRLEQTSGVARVSSPARPCQVLGGTSDAKAQPPLMLVMLIVTLAAK